jgi:hypothetical protein
MQGQLPCWNHISRTCRVVIVLLAVLHKAPAIDVTHIAAPSLAPQEVKTAHALTKGQAHLNDRQHKHHKQGISAYSSMGHTHEAYSLTCIRQPHQAQHGTAGT